MKFYNEFSNSHLLDRQAAVLQIKQYLQDRQVAIDSANVEAASRATNSIERLVKEYGVQALHKAQELL